MNFWVGGLHDHIPQLSNPEIVKPPPPRQSEAGYKVLTKALDQLNSDLIRVPSRNPLHFPLACDTLQ